MTWSTRQIAEMAGTTVKTVRHYHHIGLLDEPERSANGYKRYEAAHLVRLLQIKRLVDRGLPLSKIDTIGRSDVDPHELLRVIDAGLASSIERLQHIRIELGTILRDQASSEQPPNQTSEAV